jgi:hypothetical protein
MAVIFDTAVEKAVKVLANHRESARAIFRGTSAGAFSFRASPFAFCLRQIETVFETA